MKQTFGTIKIGVCDCFWRPVPTDVNPNPDEIFLGLTKGGVMLTYTPEWHDITVDQFGNTNAESVLIGERVSVSIPLAETDLNKLELFVHTANKIVEGNKTKLTFGRRPGFRLEGLAGQLRLHPIAMGNSKEDDVIIYRAVNRAALELNYRLDQERIFNTEFQGMVERQSVEDELNGVDGNFLWQIGE